MAESRGDTVRWQTGSGRRGAFWAAVAVVEVSLAAIAVVKDVFVPTVVILVLATASLIVRRDGLSTLGIARLGRPWRSAAEVLALTIGWTVLQLALFLPALEHLTGTKQDLSEFAGLQGNLRMLMGLLGLSWTVAAIGEELVYRGYIQIRITDVLGTGTGGAVAVVAVSSALFGLAHTEQGLLGVAATCLDGVFFSVLRMRYRTLWAPVLAHGFNNSIGLTAYFLAGPMYGLW